MAKQQNPAFGDLVADPKTGETPGVDGFDIVAAIAIRYGASFDAVMSEIQGAGILARVARDITDIPPREKKPTGPKPDLEAAWRFFVFIENSRNRGEKEEVALRCWLEMTDPQRATDKRAVEAAKKAYQRARRRWADLHVPEALHALFTGPPPAGHNRRN